MKTFVLAAGLFVLAGFAAAATRAPAVASTSCAEAGRGKIARRVLVIGESWASHGRLLPELPAGLARRTGERVRVCSVGYSGRNSAKVLASRSSGQEQRALGGAPDTVVILLGVNDQIQHRGAAFFGDNVDALRREYRGARVAVVSPPRVSDHPDLPFHQSLKNTVQGIFNRDGHAAYVAALASRFEAGQIVRFEEFSAGYPADSTRYAPDGIHLTTAAFHEYGRFIAARLPI